ncbi:MAG: hypothetical protein ACRC50_07960, partial [Gaiella sp.]
MTAHRGRVADGVRGTAEGHSTADSRWFVTELWFLPDGSRILELSTGCSPAEALQLALEMRAWLESIGIDLRGAQEAVGVS